jgi:hypothetical protein
MNFIILTPEQASQVIGRHGQYSALDPFPLKGGQYGLPVDVFNDPDLIDVHDFLATLPIEDAEIEEPEVTEELVE